MLQDDMNSIVTRLEALRANGVSTQISVDDVVALERHGRHQRRIGGRRWKRGGWQSYILILTSTAGFVIFHYLEEIYPNLRIGQLFLGAAAGGALILAFGFSQARKTRRRHLSDPFLRGERMIGVDGDILWAFANQKWSLYQSWKSFDRIDFTADHVFAFILSNTAIIFRRDTLSHSTMGQAVLSWLERAAREAAAEKSNGQVSMR